MQELLEPGFIGRGTGVFAGVYGRARKAYGVLGSSDEKSGVLGLSAASNGVTGATQSENPNRAGVYGASVHAPGVYGNSKMGAGIRGNSVSGPAGLFNGEVHIVNGHRLARLKIDDMEDDPEAPCLVWSDDKYVRKRACWQEDEDGYLITERGIRVVGGENGAETVFEVKPDGTSIHKGLEFFAAGLAIPIGEMSLIRITPDEGLVIIKNNNLLFHADPEGNVQVRGTLSGHKITATDISAESISAAEKSFKIDHPLDPENKYLVHASIESDERLNIYSGNAITNDRGFATVSLPAWFETLNRDFRYQLTVMGQFAQAIIAEEIRDGQFVIRTDRPSIKVSWLVAGVRHDAWARANPMAIEIEKTP